MDEESKLSLQLNRTSLIDELEVESVQDYLYQEGVLIKTDLENINAEKTNSQKVRLLLDLLPRRGPRAFNVFVEAVNRAEQTHLVDKLRNAQRPRTRQRHLSGGQIQAIMINGAVPPRPVVYKERPEIQKIRSQLEKIIETPGWVVVHGMTGIGKSVLASESVRDNRVLTEYFPNGVHWISIGQINPDKDPQMMLVKMQALLTRLDKQGKSMSEPRNIEEATDRLRTVFLEQYPKSLLILDDIWFQSALRVFDIQCRVLVTTRDASITDKVSGNVHKVPVEQGFTSDQTKQVLSEWTKIDIDQLPTEAEKFYKEVKGSPFAIAMIGALLRDHPRRWTYYADLLGKRNVSKFKRALSYQYETLTEAVGMSVNSLPDELKNYYLQFAVFEGDIKIPAQVLCVLWSEDMETVEDNMTILVNKSLAFQEESKSGDVYYLHDLHLDFLKEQCTDPKILHEKLVKKYKDSCGGQFHRLQDDGYIFWYIGDHLNKAGMFEEMGKLFFDLRFVARKINATGLSNVISDYTQLSRILRIVDQKKQQDFSKFLAHLSVDRSKDIIQCGLVQNKKSEVYDQASVLYNNTDKDLDKHLKKCPRDSKDTITIGEKMFICDASSFKLLGNIGTSRTSVVNKVKHIPTGTIMAIKRINTGQDSRIQKKLLKDLDVSMRSSSSLHTVHFYGALFHEGDVQICMELMDTSLEAFYRKVFKKKQTIPEKILCKIAEAVLEALLYLQTELRVAHRDVKPPNILLNREGLVKLCDFGISSQLQDSKAKTVDDGCKPYMAPERINPEISLKYYDVRSDVWSLGITMMEVAEGRHPYAGHQSIFKQLSSVVEDDPPRLPDDKGYSSDFKDFISCCLQKDYKNRPKYNVLHQHPFITMYEDADIDLAEYVKSILDG